MTGKPLYVRDLEKMRGCLKVSALNRVRLIVEAATPEVVEVDEEPGDGILSIRMECMACEELLEWSASRAWWICPACQQETTEKEATDLFRVCFEAFRKVLGVEDDDETREDESRGIGRWVKRLTGRYSNRLFAKRYKSRESRPR